MKNFSVYDTKTGAILRTGTCPDDMFEMQAGEGEAIIEGGIQDDRFFIVDGEPVEIPPRPSNVHEFDYAARKWVDRRGLDAARAQARFKLQRWAAVERANHITILPGQEMIYLAKETEALSYLADPDPDLSDYTFIAREVGITGTTAYEVAQIWAFMSAKWREVAAGLEQTRLHVAAAIDEAKTVAEVDATVDKALAQATETLKSLGVAT